MRAITKTSSLMMILAVAPIWAAAAQQGPPPFREPEVQSYKLSMEKVRQVVEVNRNLIALFKSDPELVTQIKRDNQARQGQRRPTIRETAAQFEKYPEIRAVFTKSGGSIYDLSVAMGALTSAWFALEIKEGRLTPRAAPPPDTPAEKANLALLEANRTEWLKLRDEFMRVAQNSPFTQ